MKKGKSINSKDIFFAIDSWFHLPWYHNNWSKLRYFVKTIFTWKTDFNRNSYPGCGWVGERVARFFTHNLNAKKTLKFSITSYDLVLSLSNSRPQPDESPTSELYLSRKTAFKDRWIFRYRYRKVLAQCVVLCLFLGKKCGTANKNILQIS